MLAPPAPLVVPVQPVVTVPTRPQSRVRRAPIKSQKKEDNILPALRHTSPMTHELPQNGYETILATQNRLDQVVLNLNQQRNKLQQSEANVRKKIVALIQQQRSLIDTTDRSNERQQQSIDFQEQKQRLAKAERAIRDKLDLLVEDETQLLHAFRALEDRIVLDRAMKANQVEEQQRQEEARARSERITRLIEEQSRAVRQMQQEEDDEREKQKQQPGETKTSATTKKKNTHQSNPIDDGCSVCLIPVRFTWNAMFHSDN